MARYTITGGHGLREEEREFLEDEINSGMSRCQNKACKHVDAVHSLNSTEDYGCNIPGCNCVNGHEEGC